MNVPFDSDRKYKKKQVCVKDSSGKIINIHYGDNRYEDYTQHKDKDRRKSFRARHGCDTVSELKKDTAKFWACEDLW